MPSSRLLIVALGIVVLPDAAATQTLQYRSRAGVEYRSQPDTGPVARARAASNARPTDVQLLIQRGIAESAARRFLEAIQTFSRALEIAPRNAVLYRWRGHRYLSVRQFDLAARDFEVGMGLDSAVYGIWYHLGVLRFVRGDFAGAADAFARAQPLAPDAGELAGSVDWRWMSLMRAGRRAAADSLLSARPDSLPVTNAYRQRLRLYRGEIGPEQVITPADTSDVQLATLSFGVGNWYLTRGNGAKAREWFQRAVASGGWPAFGFMAAEAELARFPEGESLDTLTLTISARSVRIVLPVGHRDSWQWRMPATPDNRQEYAWEIRIDSAETRGFGFYLFKFPGLPSEAGSLQQLLRSGQRSVWEKASRHMERMVERGRIEMSPADSGVVVTVRDGWTADFLFGSRPTNGLMRLMNPGRPNTMIPIRFEYAP